MRKRPVALALASASVLVAACATPAQTRRDAEPRVEDAAMQPARDVGLVRATTPDVLMRAVANPYGLDGLQSCQAIAGAIAELDEALGPDLDQRNPENPDVITTERAAEIGTRTLVNAIIPFRGVVRELTGAAAADRRLQEAVLTGVGRRSFLRGVYHARACQPPITPDRTASGGPPALPPQR